jgi:F-box and WD-40 domain protein 1/11
MDPYNESQPDEGYSEDPLNPTTSLSFPEKSLDDISTVLARLNTARDVPAWLSGALSVLPVEDRTRE